MKRLNFIKRECGFRNPSLSRCTAAALVLGLACHAGPAAAQAAGTVSPGMALIPAGEFVQGGSPQAAYRLCIENNDSCNEDWFTDEAPARRVYVDAFEIDRYEVTQNAFRQAMGRNPSEFQGGRRPVDNVTWEEADAYCRKAGKRLPTEAEWEKAAKAGAKTLYPWGNRMESGRANFCDAHCEKRWKEAQFEDGYAHTAPVGSFPPNAFSLHDMLGNVYEWVADWYASDYYAAAPDRNPQGPPDGNRKVMRGGSWINYSSGARPADRTDADPDERMPFTGFRCARSL